MNPSPPLRFLAIVLGGWAALRTAIVAPPWWAPPADAADGPRARSLARAGAVPPGPAGAAAPPAGAVAASRKPSAPPSTPLPSPARSPAERRARPATPPIVIAGVRTEAWASSAIPSQSFAAAPAPASGPRPARRWSLSAWAFVRRGDSAPLAPGGLLGGSQAGARLAFRLNRDRERPLALSARLSAPLRRRAGAEAALGLDWRPARRLPIHLLAERRQALGREGRSAFGLTFYGGVSDRPVGPLRLDAYAQAGVVGARSLDLFGDGSVRLSVPLNGKVRFGAGAWAAAQPGVSRLDLGPQAAFRLPVAGRHVTLAADWRLRASGEASPGSGPTVTLATDF